MEACLEKVKVEMYASQKEMKAWRRDEGLSREVGGISRGNEVYSGA
jgi:hypothetical protein